MEFNKKLQELRKQKGFTQEELAAALYVSRTAISKWESGRGYPNIDSLKAISKFFGVTVDELLSGEELLVVAETDSKEKQKRFRDLAFSLLDCSAVILFFLPFFAQRSNGIIQEVSLLSLTDVAAYLRAAYYALIIGIVVFGILTLALQNFHQAFWERNKNVISLVLTAVGALLFVISLQPYAAVLLLVLLAIQVFLLIKR